MNSEAFASKNASQVHSDLFCCNCCSYSPSFLVLSSPETRRRMGRESVSLAVALFPVCHYEERDGRRVGEALRRNVISFQPVIAGVSGCCRHTKCTSCQLQLFARFTHSLRIHCLLSFSFTSHSHRQQQSVSSPSRRAACCIFHLPTVVIGVYAGVRTLPAASSDPLHQTVRHKQQKETFCDRERQASERDGESGLHSDQTTQKEGRQTILSAANDDDDDDC